MGLPISRFYRARGEVEKGQCRECLEEAGMVGQISGSDEAFGGGVDLEVKPGKLIVGDRLAIDLNTLVNAGEVGRGVESCAVASCGEDAGQGGGGGSLAVGSGDQDRGEPILGISQSTCEDTHVLQVELTAGADRCGGIGSELKTTTVQVIDCCSVRHVDILAVRVLKIIAERWNPGWR
jgi:hypothetical protein